ncbi:MAG TPA: Gfo/Idh/MocA family oxidoreductase [Spirochaetota bacterium]|nr:Gfo/Idh/MocA family oxidoreductase [Spirochaetota bacterium]
MVKDKFNASIIGVGRIGFTFQFDKKREQPASHSIALKKNKNIKLTAACDIDKDKLSLWKKHYNKSKVYISIKDFLKNEKSDIIVIAVNEDSHLDITLKAIKKQPKLIILEKPIAPNIKEALLIKKYSEKFNVPICINHERRYSIDYQITKKLIEEKKLGDVESVIASFWSGAKVYKKGSEKYGDCSLIHDGTHLIDIIDYLFDIKFDKPKINKISFDDGKNVTFLNVFFNEKIYDQKEKTLFNLEFSGNKKVFGFELDIRGTMGRVVIGNGYLNFYERKSSPYYKGFYSLVRNKKIKRPKLTKYFSNMVSNCVNFLQGKEPLVSNVSTGVKVIEIIYKIISKLKKYFDI